MGDAFVFSGPSGFPTLLGAGLRRAYAIWIAQLGGVVRPFAWALAVVLVCTLIERLAPAEPGQGWRGRLRNLAHLVVFQSVGLAGLTFWNLFGPVFDRPSRSPSALAAGLLVVANLLAIDVLYYAYHRAQHRFAWLWAIHELHHADAELNATSSFRTYWLELPVQTIVVSTPTLLLFGDCGPIHGLGTMIGSFAFLIFSHCNFRLSLGPLSSVVCGPQVHRIHHSRLPEHRDRNFAQYFPFLDRLFGTYYAPAKDEFPPTGADGLASDASVAVAFMRPFRIWFAGLARPRRAAQSSKSPRDARGSRRQ